LQADLSLVDEAYDLDVVFGVEPLRAGYRTRGDDTRAVTRTGAPRNFTRFTFTNRVVSYI
jgi:hypothetical protein